MNLKKLLVLPLLFLAVSLYSQELPKDVTVKNISGESVAIKDILKGEPVIITFWSTTCKPCVSELKALMQISSKWQGKVRIIAVSIDDARSVAKVKSLVKGNKFDFEVYIDTNKALYHALNLTVIPAAMVIGADGKILYSHTGYMPGDESVLVNEALKRIKKE